MAVQVRLLQEPPRRDPVVLGAATGRRRIAVAFAAALLAASPLVAQQGASADRAEEMEREIDRLRSELGDLRGRERGVLGSLERLGAELRLRDAELRDASGRLEITEQAIARLEAQIARLEGEQLETRRYLEFRLREIYKRGPAQELRRLVGGSEVEAYVDGLRYAAWLSDRDARTLRAHLQRSRILREDAARLSEERERQVAARGEAAEARTKLARARRERSRMLAAIRRDRASREGALEELESASRELGRLVGTLDAGRPGRTLDARKFRGLLDPPAEGPVSAGFGKVVHPKFKTEVPHPGLDIDAPAGAPFHSVFAGTVVFASWLQGYGLTVIVDHGNAVLSVYAHGSVLLVEKGETVRRNQALGRVGDTGSLRGPYLYFELRRDGEPVDPLSWFRPSGG